MKAASLFHEDEMPNGVNESERMLLESVFLLPALSIREEAWL